MIKSLTAKEEVLMNIFWAHGPLFIRDVISYLPEPKPHYNTIATLVKILEKKGFLEREPMANSFRHKVKISERQYRGRKVSDVVANHYNNSYLSLVSQFVEEEKIDLADLKALIASLKSSSHDRIPILYCPERTLFRYLLCVLPSGDAPCYLLSDESDCTSSGFCDLFFASFT